ncbi:MAG: FGGY-family carbohydrate kinase, partial [Pyrinomonadaceae bacterium]
TAQAGEINGTRHRVLEYVGGQISPEQEPPKLLWVKEHLPESWSRARRFFDLADYLVYEACKRDVRSFCTVVCKWTYMGHEGEHGRWDTSFFEQIGLADLFTPNRVGERVRPMGTPAGKLTKRAAGELGLAEGTTVGVGIIDAHAGGLGSLGMTGGGAGGDFSVEQVERTLALVGGTSSCHMATSPEARFIPGVWGPYFGAMIPGMWLTEGGQSATGALLDHVIDNHAHAPQLRREAREHGATVYELLNGRVEEMRRKARGDDGGDAAAPSSSDGGHYFSFAAELTADLHVLPDFHGNRSPRADAHARGMVSGLALDSSFESLARVYLATIQAVAYGTRHIIEALNGRGYRITRIHASGGGTKNPLWLQQHADITGCEVYVAHASESVLLGAAILAAVAAGKYQSIVEAMGAMSPRAEVVRPRPESSAFHGRKYEVFKLMYEHQQEYRRIVQSSRAPSGAA